MRAERCPTFNHSYTFHYSHKVRSRGDVCSGATAWVHNCSAGGMRCNMWWSGFYQTVRPCGRQERGAVGDRQGNEALGGR